MAKFKVGDKVIPSDTKEWSNREKYKIILGVYKKQDYDCYTIDGFNTPWFDEELELYKEELNMEKTFREVIRDIKEGEVWECTRKNARIKRVRLNGTVDEGLLTFDYGEMITEDKSAIRCTDRFILRRKEYTFEEVFRAYKEGKEIESVHSGYRYKKENGKDLFFSKLSEMWEENNEFKTKEIMNMWYIND